MSAVDDLLEWVHLARRRLETLGAPLDGLPPHLADSAAEVARRRRGERATVADLAPVGEDPIPTPQEGQNQKENPHG